MSDLLKIHLQNLKIMYIFQAKKIFEEFWPNRDLLPPSLVQEGEEEDDNDKHESEEFEKEMGKCDIKSESIKEEEKYKENDH